MNEPSEHLLRRWLLDELPADEAAPLERRLLEDDDFGERLRAAETDLLDDYARGRLGERERARAAALFSATAEDRMRVRIAAALAHAREPAPLRAAAHERVDRSRRRFFRVRGAVAAALLASAAAIAIVVGLRERFQSASTAIATVSLTADRQRGAGIEDIDIPRGADRVRLQVEVDGGDSASRFALSIDETAAHAFVVHDLAARASGPYRFVEADVPATALSPGEHRVRVVVEGAPGTGSSWIVRARRE